MPNNFIKSENIRVFPTSFRNNVETSVSGEQGATYNPESKLTTEENIVNLVSRLTNQKSFVVELNTLTNKEIFNINGYLFEVKDISTTFNGWNEVYATISIAPITGTSLGGKTYSSIRLVNQKSGSSSSLDVRDGATDVFGGIKFSNTLPSSVDNQFSLHILHKGETSWEVPNESLIRLNTSLISNVEDKVAISKLFKTEKLETTNATITNVTSSYITSSLVETPNINSTNITTDTLNATDVNTTNVSATSIITDSIGQDEDVTLVNGTLKSNGINAKFEGNFDGTLNGTMRVPSAFSEGSEENPPIVIGKYNDIYGGYNTTSTWKNAHDLTVGNSLHSNKADNATNAENSKLAEKANILYNSSHKTPYSDVTGNVVVIKVTSVVQNPEGIYIPYEKYEFFDFIPKINPFESSVDKINYFEGTPHIITFTNRENSTRCFGVKVVYNRNTNCLELKYTTTLYNVSTMTPKDMITILGVATSGWSNSKPSGCPDALKIEIVERDFIK